jgi:protein-L-isoaspartate(D-aspartate) O-methyltransferase
MSGILPEHRGARAAMVAEQLRMRDIDDEKVIAAMETIERHRFVPVAVLESAYDDMPLPIGHGQTISQPYIVAFMTQALQLAGNETVLEVGAGCGYQSAVLSLLSKHVYALEIIAALVETARENLRTAGRANVTVMKGDGYFGLPQHAPYDAILVAAAARDVPRVLEEELAENGRMIIPVGQAIQELCLVTKHKGIIKKEMLLDVRFVPLVH